MDAMFQQLWDKFISQDISVTTAIEMNANSIKRRDLDTFSALLSANDKEKALALLIEIVDATPCWNPVATTNALNKIAEYLVSCGQFEDAVQFAELGLKWDPCHPELITLICKSTYNFDQEKSFKYFLYLNSISYPAGLLEGYTPPVLQKQIDMYQPSLDGLRKGTNDELFRLMVFLAAALHRRPLFESIDGLRSHAVACLLSGHPHMALVAARLALFRLKDPLYISGLNPSVILMKKKWMIALEQLIISLIDASVKTTSVLTGIKITERLWDRKIAIEELVAKRNTQGLFCFVMDPVPEISFLACQHLIESGDGWNLKEYLQSAAKIENEIKEVYGSVKPHLLTRMLPGANVSNNNDKSGAAVYSSQSTANETDAPVKKVVRKKAKSKDDEDLDDELPAKKRTVVKKVVRRV